MHKNQDLFYPCLLQNSHLIISSFPALMPSLPAFVGTSHRAAKNMQWPYSVLVAKGQCRQRNIIQSYLQQPSHLISSLSPNSPTNLPPTPTQTPVSPSTNLPSILLTQPHTAHRQTPTHPAKHPRSIPKASPTIKKIPNSLPPCLPSPLSPLSNFFQPSLESLR